MAFEEKLLASLPPIEHERDAWVRHMLVPDVADLDGYVTDAMPAGRTG